MSCWKTRIFTIFVATLSVFSASCSRDGKPSDDFERFVSVDPHVTAPIENMRPVHPRLLVTIHQIARARDLSKSDPIAKSYYAKILQYANAALPRQPISWSTPATIDNARDMQRFV